MLERTLAALVAALLLVGASAGGAGAEQRVQRDPRGDVWQLSTSSAAARPAPGTRDHDVRRTSFRHGPWNFVVRSTFVGLRRAGSYASFSTRVVNGRGKYREVVVETSPRSRAGRARVFNRAGRPVGCKVDHRVDYRRDTFTVWVSRSCLDRPQRIRATAASYWATRGRIYTDNAHNRSPRVRAWTRWVEVG